MHSIDIGPKSFYHRPMYMDGINQTEYGKSVTIISF